MATTLSVAFTQKTQFLFHVLYKAVFQQVLIDLFSGRTQIWLYQIMLVTVCVLLQDNELTDHFESPKWSCDG